MRPVWKWGLFIAVGTALGIYTWLGFLASTPTMVPIKLVPGETVEVSTRRYSVGKLRMQAWDYGEARSRMHEVRDSVLNKKFAEAGTHLEIDVSIDGNPPERYLGSVPYSFTSNSTGRDFHIPTQSPYSAPKYQTLSKGINVIKITVVNVEGFSYGNENKIEIKSNIGYNYTDDDVSYLGNVKLWPLYFLIYFISFAIFIFRRLKVRFWNTGEKQEGAIE